MSAHLQTINPRAAAGLIGAEWERARKLRRRREWDQRRASRDMARTVIREASDVVINDADFWRQGNCLDPSVPLGFTPCPFRFEAGVSAISYYRSKYLRCGTLGRFAPMSPFANRVREWEQERRHAN
jgi:hypothetical protein